jgi:poly(hydroxyalkanoate) depolymerase family esterase
MINLRHALSLGRSRDGWRKFLRPLGPNHAGWEGKASTRLREIFGFGSNPGNLRMFAYRPPTLADNAALVVVLHGCTQTAAGYDLGAGWSTLADRYGFALLLPEQQRSNNPNGCFNWFQPAHSRRNYGEPLSIRQMIERSIVDWGIDRRRVFVTGLSAGGAMTSVMLACYPEVFAGGAIIAGLPYGAATNVQQAFETMFQSPSRSPGEWGDLVRKASSHRGPWPRVSVWHGNADKTVIPSNALEILKQWTEVHGLLPR